MDSGPSLLFLEDYLFFFSLPFDLESLSFIIAKPFPPAARALELIKWYKAFLSHSVNNNANMFM